MTIIRVGTRKSKLAMAQTQLVVSQLEKLYPDFQFELVPFTTKGDKLIHIDLQKIGGKGVFVKDIEAALLLGKIDMAVHSLKDVPSVLAEGCRLGAVTKREDVRDCLLFRERCYHFDTLPSGSIVGTSSLRRQVQLQSRRPDLIYKPIRGNIDTRIEKMRRGEYDAIVLAQAGLNRLGWNNRKDLYTELLEVGICLPAISQAALGIECRQDDTFVLELLSGIHDFSTAACVEIERAILSLMNADCTFPIGALAQLTKEGYHLDVMMAKEDGTCIYVSTDGTDSKQLAEETVELLKERGAFGVK